MFQVVKALEKILCYNNKKIRKGYYGIHFIWFNCFSCNIFGQIS